MRGRIEEQNKYVRSQSNQRVFRCYHHTQPPTQQRDSEYCQSHWAPQSWPDSEARFQNVISNPGFILILFASPSYSRRWLSRHDARNNRVWGSISGSTYAVWRTDGRYRL